MFLITNYHVINESRSGTPNNIPIYISVCEREKFRIRAGQSFAQTSQHATSLFSERSVSFDTSSSRTHQPRYLTKPSDV
jgi:hypothetical protein